MSRRKKPKPATGFGQSKHRGARVQRFAARHRGSDKIACLECGKSVQRCTCRVIAGIKVGP